MYMYVSIIRILLESVAPAMNTNNIVTRSAVTLCRVRTCVPSDAE
jgi:hypothetical protein